MEKKMEARLGELHLGLDFYSSKQFSTATFDSIYFQSRKQERNFLPAAGCCRSYILPLPPPPKHIFRDGMKYMGAPTIGF